MKALNDRAYSSEGRESEVRLGVLCSPNRHLDMLRVLGKFDVAWRKIKLLPDVCPGRRLGFAGETCQSEYTGVC